MQVQCCSYVPPQQGAQAPYISCALAAHNLRSGRIPACKPGWACSDLPALTSWRCAAHRVYATNLHMRVCPARGPGCCASPVTNAGLSIEMARM